MNILYQSDNNYAPYMGVSVCSLFENNKEADTIEVYVIDDGIDTANKEKLIALSDHYKRSIRFLTGERILEDEDIVKAFEYTEFRKNTHSYFKLFADRLIPELDERIIYIDCDTVVEGNITGLLDIDMKGKPIGMVQDSLVTSAKTAVGINDNERYYNSGVILIDLKEWKEHKCSKRIYEHIRDIRTYGTVDQDVLNVELHNEIVTLPVGYNLQPIHLDYHYGQYSKVYKHKEPYYSGKEIEEAVKAPGILHFLRYVGESPWHADNVHPCTPYFDKYMAISPWKDYVKKPSGKGGIFKIEKLMYKLLPKFLFLRIFYLVHDRMLKKSNAK
ncbi:MAG: glycosyltransferase family 8 protein [Lachnospiraceae bacterium]|nr:glycosyltransferase family 8 protein [Lachnospiraceae bacterium]